MVVRVGREGEAESNSAEQKGARLGGGSWEGLRAVVELIGVEQFVERVVR